MAVHYVGGEPTRITCYTQRKNTSRWMETSKHKQHAFNAELIFCIAMDIASVIALIAFIVVCFR